MQCYEKLCSVSKPARKCAIPGHMRREVVVLEPGKDVTGLKRVGYERTEVLDYQPRLFGKEILLPIYFEPMDLTETLVITASLPGQMLEKCKGAESLLAQMVVERKSKTFFMDLCRQAANNLIHILLSNHYTGWYQ